MALKKQVLIVSQVIPQWYVDVLTDALGEGVHIDIITGSNVRGNVIKSPKHEADSLKSRLVCWYRHFRFVNQWIKENQSIKKIFLKMDNKEMTLKYFQYNK